MVTVTDLMMLEATYDGMNAHAHSKNALKSFCSKQGAAVKLLHVAHSDV